MADPAKVQQVFDWILMGATEHQIAEAIAQAWPNEEARPLIAAAVAKLSDAANCDPSLVFGFCFEATRSLYRRMLEIGDFVGALRAVKQMADLANRKPATE